MIQVKKEKRGFEDQPKKQKGILNVLWKLVLNNMGITIQLFNIISAEGSLNQHIKLKHPELIKERGLSMKSNENS